MIARPQCGTDEPVDEERLDEKFRYSTYKRKRSKLFAIKLGLFFLLWTAGWTSFPDPGDDVSAIGAAAGLGYWALIPYAAYALAALICAPFKIVWTARRLRAHRSSFWRWASAWSATIIARFALFALCPLTFLTALCKQDVVAVGVFLIVLVLSPVATIFAYELEKVALRKPGASLNCLARTFFGLGEP
ncbi:MAG: hypothetical protein J6X44_12585 [Thermoguttaceae bacterium]|nr:hypothetical protein [Thermoguttaceae bacterium]